MKRVKTLFRIDTIEIIFVLLRHQRTVVKINRKKKQKIESAEQNQHILLLSAGIFYFKS